MRSRYTAYALGKAGYVMRTTDPAGPHHRADARAWQAEIEDWCARTELVGLEVLASDEDGDVGHVTFRAHVRQGGQAGVMEERSLFFRKDGRWLYHGEAP